MVRQPYTIEPFLTWEDSVALTGFAASTAMAVNTLETDLIAFGPRDPQGILTVLTVFLEVGKSKTPDN